MVEGREGSMRGGARLRPLENSTPEPHASQAVGKARRRGVRLTHPADD